MVQWRIQAVIGISNSGSGQRGNTQGQSSSQAGNDVRGFDKFKCAHVGVWSFALLRLHVWVLD